MVEEPVRLHLGCGGMYLPGFVNIDLNDTTVADLQANAMSLPYPPGSVSRIEAYHLIEHVDRAHAVVLLSHLYRLLDSGGVLILETPDIGKACAEYRKATDERKRPLLQWIYGVQGSGMEHRTGYDPKSLEDLLTEIGFTDIRIGDQQTHRYEDGFRIVSRKPKVPILDNEIKAEFTTRVYQHFPCLRDSMDLVPLERSCLNRFREEWSSSSDTNAMLSLLAVHNSKLALVLLETISLPEFHTCLTSLGTDNRKNWIGNIIRHLEELQFHQRLFTLWARSKKTPGRSGGDFGTFVEEKESLVHRLLTSEKMDRSEIESSLRYIATLPPEPDLMFFHQQAVRTRAKVLLNQGIKAFSQGNLDHASHHFTRSIALDPDPYLTHWNLGRISFIMKMDLHAVGGFYKTTLDLAKAAGENAAVRLIERDLKSLRKRDTASIPEEPVTELTIFE